MFRYQRAIRRLGHSGRQIFHESQRLGRAAVEHALSKDWRTQYVCAPLTATRDTTAAEFIADYVLINQSTVLLVTVWAIFWIIFEAAVITGFVLLGIACFKLSKEQMYAQAGVCARF